MIQSQYARKAEQLLHNKGKYTTEKKNNISFVANGHMVKSFKIQIYERKTHKKIIFYNDFHLEYFFCRLFRRPFKEYDWLWWICLRSQVNCPVNKKCKYPFNLIQVLSENDHHIRSANVLKVVLQVKKSPSKHHA